MGIQSNTWDIRWVIRSKINFSERSHNSLHYHQNAYLHYHMTWEINGYAKQLISLGVHYNQNNKTVFISQLTSQIFNGFHVSIDQDV